MRKRLRKLLRVTGLVCLALLGFGLTIGCCAFSAPKHRGPPSAHFDGETFQNRGLEPQGFGSFIRWMWERDQAVWPEAQAFEPGPKPPERVDGGAIRVTFVNHATLLIQQDGLNVLTDPVWSERVSPVSWAGPKRIRPPGIRFEDLPPIDLVVISHNHYDHLNLETLKRIAERFPEARFAVPLGNAQLLAAHGIQRVRDHDWGDESKIGAVRIVSVRNQHFSGRGLCDRNATLWSAWAIIGPSGTSYFAGDTGYGDHFAEARKRLGKIRLAVLPIGAYRPEWFMGQIHTSPIESIQAAKDLEATTSVGMHFGTFPLADDGHEEAPKALAAALALDPKPPTFWVLGFGEGRDVPP